MSASCTVVRLFLSLALGTLPRGTGGSYHHAEGLNVHRQDHLAILAI
jgi:hypothetical protein